MIELTSKLSSVVSHVNQQSFHQNQSTDCDTAPFCRWQGANGDRPTFSSRPVTVRFRRKRRIPIAFYVRRVLVVKTRRLNPDRTNYSFKSVLLALLWQNVFAPLFFKDLLSARWALPRRRPKDEIDDGVTYGGHGWLRRRPVDSFFSAPRMRGGDVAGRRRQSLSSGRGDEDLAMTALRSDQVQAPPSTADAPAHKSTVP